MPSTTLADADPAASLLAIMVAADGHIDARELAELDRLRAYQRLGVDRPSFLWRAEAARQEIGTSLSRTQWLRLGDQWRLLCLQQAVADPALRLLVGRLSAAVITADGRVTGDERLVYASMLRNWSLTQAMVAEAIMRDGSWKEEAGHGGRAEPAGACA